MGGRHTPPDACGTMRLCSEGVLRVAPLSPHHQGDQPCAGCHSPASKASCDDNAPKRANACMQIAQHASGITSIADFAQHSPLELQMHHIVLLPVASGQQNVPMMMWDYLLLAVLGLHPRHEPLLDPTHCLSEELRQAINFMFHPAKSVPVLLGALPTS